MLLEAQGSEIPWNSTRYLYADQAASERVFAKYELRASSSHLVCAIPDARLLFRHAAWQVEFIV